MPNRIIKDSIHDSETVNSMTDFQFRLWVNLITYVDDYGRGDARPAIIKGKCFPLRDRLTNKDIEAALNALAGIGCVCLYKVDGKPYLYFPNWESHQRIRQKVSKYPAPLHNSELPQSAASCGELRPESNTIQSEYKYESEYESNNSAEPKEIGSPPVAFLPLIDGSEYGVSSGDVEQWEKSYPAVDVMQALGAMRSWLDANPKNRKTKAGIKRFIVSWLSKNQDRAPRVSQNAKKDEGWSWDDFR